MNDVRKAAALESAYSKLEASYIESHPKSKAIYESALEALPGGNTRTVLFFAPFPFYTSRASGSSLITADGHGYTDLLGEYTAGLYGHSHPVIVSAITAAVQNGLNFGSQHENEAKLAHAIKERFPGVDLLRFTNSGTEANLLAITAARLFTKRKKILIFEGGYHGGVLSFGFGKGANVENGPNVPYEYVLGTYNDTASVDELLNQDASSIAAILVEPMIGSGGAIPATKEFLQHLRDAATAHSIVLIFDEVMTSRLYSGRGVQAEFNIIPDMTTLGKYIGGGMSFGAFGGKTEIMDLFDPRKGGMPHAGTFNNNTLTMAAGIAGLSQVFTPDVATTLNARGDKLRSELNSILKGTIGKVTGIGSLMNFHFTATPLERIRSPADVEPLHTRWTDVLHLEMLEKGFYLARRGYIALSLVVTDDDLGRFMGAFRGWVEKYRELLITGELRNGY